MELEDDLSTKPFDAETLMTGKKYGFSDATIARLWHTSSQEVREFRKQNEVLPVYKMIDTCAAEFASSTLISTVHMTMKTKANEQRNHRSLSLVQGQSGLVKESSLTMRPFTALRQFNGLATKQLSSIRIQKPFQQISRFPINSIRAPHA